ncbi:MAG: aminotransferase class I/II-fold pyridoxal phosphate-dependent enzyme [Candidatus Aminicenantes bacterium]|nr:aminotransferase class I/II-fold pyridoxal phosphate-dependent enzyme [Candidatus Aminicenantes bacterium]
MKIETFELERYQSLWENTVKINLTESGVHPYTTEELLTKKEIKQMLSLRLGYGQTNGDIELRQAICRLYPGMTIDNVLVTNGSAEANFIGMWSLLEPGDELILMLPNYMQIWGIARSFGISVKPFYLEEKLGWAPDLEKLKKLVSSKTKMIAVCNPNNPTGAVLSETAMQEIVALAKKTGAWIYADEVYRGAEMDGSETPSFAGLYDKAVVTAGLSKAYALPGLRLGWLVGPQEIIDNAWHHRDYTSISTGIVSQFIATVVLQPQKRQAVLSRCREMLNENLALLQDWVGKHAGLFSFVPPRAGGMTFLGYDMDINSSALSTKLRTEKSVFVVAGDWYGMDHYIRIGIGAEKEKLLAGLDLLDETLKELDDET